MTAQVASNVYRELWISMASLIRSYVAGHDIGLSAGRAAVEEGEDGHLSVRTEGSILTLSFDGSTGTGSWALYEDDPGPERLLSQGEFRIDDGSQVEFSDRRGKLELEVAAEAFTAKIFDEE